MLLVAQLPVSLEEILLGLVFLGVLAMILAMIFAPAILLTLFLRRRQQIPHEANPYLPRDSGCPLSQPPDGEHVGRQNSYRKKAEIIIVWAVTGAVLGGVLIWPVAIFGSFGVVLFLLDKPDVVLLITVSGASVGAILGAVVGSALSASAARNGRR